jgi:membrane protease YdiL (CAAX protease family)
MAAPDQPDARDTGAASAPAPGWGLGDAAAAYGAGAALSILAAAMAHAVDGGGDEVEFTASVVVASLVGLWVGLIGFTVRASRQKGTGSLAGDFGLHGTGADLGIGFLAGVACQYVVLSLLYWPISVLVDTGDLDEPARELTDSAHGFGAGLLGVALVIGTPVVEELFFRGLLLRSLARRFGDGWAVALSALAFGLSHFQALQFPGLFVFGLVQGWLAVRRRSLGAPIASHVAFNGITFVALMAAR